MLNLSLFNFLLKIQDDVNDTTSDDGNSDGAANRRLTGFHIDTATVPNIIELLWKTRAQR